MQDLFLFLFIISYPVTQIIDNIDYQNNRQLQH